MNLYRKFEEKLDHVLGILEEDGACQLCRAKITPGRAKYLSKIGAPAVCLKCAERYTTKTKHKPALPGAGREGESVAQEDQSAKGSTQSATKSTFGAYKGDHKKKKRKVQEPSLPRESDEFS